MCTLVLPLVLWCVASAAVVMPESDPGQGPRTFTLLFENDLFGDSDAQYTNGLKLSWMSPNLKRVDDVRIPHWALAIVGGLKALEARVIDHAEREFNVGLALGQMMFTPDDTQARALLPNDRPYAGWLYGSIAFVSKNRTVADTLEFQAGVVGPGSLAEDAQKFVHDIRDLPPPRGWDNQLENEPGFVLLYERKWRVLEASFSHDVGVDSIVHVGAAVGNIVDYLGTGVELRLGWHVPRDFGTSLIRPGGDANAPTVKGPGVATTGLGVYIFAALSGRAVGHDIFLDGNTIADSHGVDKEALVGDLVIGASVVFRGLKLSYAQAFRSREFAGQNRRHNFGSVNLSYSF